MGCCPLYLSTGPSRFSEARASRKYICVGVLDSQMNLADPLPGRHQGSERYTPICATHHSRLILINFGAERRPKGSMPSMYTCPLHAKHNSDEGELG